MRKNGKSEPTLQIGPVSCKLVGKNISRGKKPYGNHWGTYGLKGEGGLGKKGQILCPNRLTMGANQGGGRSPPGSKKK